MDKYTTTVFWAFSVCMFVQSIGLVQNMSCSPFACSISLIRHVCIIHVTIVLGDLCDNIGLVGVSGAMSLHHLAIMTKPSPILSPLLFMHVAHPYIPLFKIWRIFYLFKYAHIIS